MPSIERLGRRLALRYEPYDGGAAGEVETKVRGHGPIVYVTLGTVATFNRAPELLQGRCVVAGSDRDDKRRHLIRQAAHGEVPENFQVVSYVPQSEILPRCSLATTHGGAGSTLGALAHGVPVLVLPQGAPSQARMARACVDAGVGRALLPGDAADAAMTRDALAILN